MFKRRKVIKDYEEMDRKQFAPLYVIPGDTISGTYRDDKGVETVLATATITESIAITEAVIFKGKFEGNKAIGGLFVEKK